MAYDEQAEISLVDVAQAFRRRWRLFLFAFLAPSILITLACWYHGGRFTVVQRVQSAAYVSGAGLAPVDSVTSLLAEWFPLVLGELRTNRIMGQAEFGFQAKPVVVLNPIDRFDQKGVLLTKYIPNASIFDFSLNFSRGTPVPAAIKKAKVVFLYALQSLQATQKPVLAMRRAYWQQVSKQSTRSLSAVLHLSQMLQQSLDSGVVAGKGRAQLKAVSHFSPATPGLSNADVLSLVSADRLSNVGLSYETKITALRQSIDANNIALQTLEPARFIGQAYVVQQASKAITLLFLGVIVSFILGSVAVGFAELFKRRG